MEVLQTILDSYQDGTLIAIGFALGMTSIVMVMLNS